MTDRIVGTAPLALQPARPDIRVIVKTCALACIIWAGMAEAQETDVERDLHICRFDVECVDQDCAETDYEAEIAIEWASEKEVLLHRQGVGELSDVTGDLAILAMRSDSAMRFWTTGQGRPTMISVASGGEARMSVHMPDLPMAITYLGQCEESK